MVFARWHPHDSITPPLNSTSVMSLFERGCKDVREEPVDAWDRQEAYGASLSPGHDSVKLILRGSITSTSSVVICAPTSQRISVAKRLPRSHNPHTCRDSVTNGNASGRRDNYERVVVVGLTVKMHGGRRMFDLRHRSTARQ